jgi:hypothetical protein
MVNWVELFGDGGRRQISGPFIHEKAEQVSANLSIVLVIPEVAFDPETEVLTEDGWKKWSDVTDKDKLATQNEAGELDFQYPLQLHVSDYWGPMIHFTGKWLDLLVTPNHRMWARLSFRSGISRKLRERRKYNDFRFIEAQQCLRRMQEGKTTTIEMTAKCIWKGSTRETFLLSKAEYLGGEDRNVVNQIPIELWVQFMGWWLAEGSIAINPNGEYMVSIRNTNPDNLKEIHDLLEAMGFNAFICQNGAVVVNSKQLYQYLKPFGHSGDKYIPGYIKLLPPSLIWKFLETYIKGDGCIDRRGNVIIATKSKRLADDLQELFLRVGLNASIQTKHGSGYNPNGIYYIVTSHHKTTFRVYKTPQIIWFEGKVYCATMKSGLLLVRRNNKVVWSGNSDSNKGKIESVSMFRK